MPKRPAKHQIEDQSRARFRLLLPEAWVFRDITPDYGIDGEVEIFDETGKSTGLSFFVQLKASESKLEDQRRRVTLLKQQWAYYREKDIPVLIVKYDKIDDVFHSRWAGTTHLYHSKKQSKTFSFRLADDDKWNDSTPTKLINDVERFRRLKSGSLKFPISVQLIFDRDAVQQVPISALRSKVRSAFDATNANLTLAKIAHQEFDVTVRVDNNEMAVIFGCQTGMTLHGHKLGKSEKFVEDLPRLIVEGIAIAAGYFGQYGLASSLVLSSKEVLSTKTQTDVAGLLATFLLRAGHFEEALTYANRLFETEEDQAVEIAFRIAAMRTARHMPYDERQKFEGYLYSRLQREIDRGNQTQIGIAHYNLGNHLRSVRKFSWAVHHYKCAGRFSPFYLKQPYYFQEFGGALFQGGRFKMAAKFYERALAGDDIGRSCALYADALMFSGQYEDALDQFKKYFASTDDPDPEWVLKAYVLGLLIDAFDIKIQKRKKVEASKSVIWDLGASIEERKVSYQKAIRLDALCSLAWFNSGVTNSEQAKRLEDSHWREAALSFLIAALTQTNDYEAWSNAVLCAFNHKKISEYIPLIVICAFSINGDHFLNDLNDRVLKQPGIDDPKPFLNLVEEIALEAKTVTGDSIMFRMLNDDGSVEILGESL